MTKPTCDYRPYFQGKTCGEPAVCAFATSAMGWVVYYACCDLHKPKSAFLYNKYSLEEIAIMEIMNS